MLNSYPLYHVKEGSGRFVDNLLEMEMGDEAGDYVMMWAMKTHEDLLLKEGYR